MDESRKTQYVKSLDKSAYHLCQIRMDMGEKGIYEVPEGESIHDLKQILNYKMIVDDLVSEMVEDEANSRTDSFMEDEAINSKFDRTVVFGFLLKSSRGNYYNKIYKYEGVFDEVIWDLVSEAGMNLPEEIMDRKIEIGPILLRQLPNKRLGNLARQISSLYLLGQWTATIVFCRALLEDVLKKFDSPGSPWKRKTIGHRDEALWRWFARVSEGIYPGDSTHIENATNAIKRAGKLIHGNEDVYEPKSSDCLKIVGSCFEIAEFLLNIHETK